MIVYSVNEPNTLSADELYAFLKETDGLVRPTLSSRVDLGAYAKKIVSKAVIFTACDDGQLIGLTAIYFNKAPGYSYATLNMVKKEYQKTGMVGPDLSCMAGEYACSNGSAGMRFECRKSNKALIRYHMGYGAKIIKESYYPGTDEVCVLMEFPYINNDKAPE